MVPFSVRPRSAAKLREHPIPYPRIHDTTYLFRVTSAAVRPETASFPEAAAAPGATQRFVKLRLPGAPSTTPPAPTGELIVNAAGRRGFAGRGAGGPGDAGAGPVEEVRRWGCP